MNLIPTTRNGYEQLLKKLHHLKHVKRPMIAKEMEATRAEWKIQGDEGHGTIGWENNMYQNVMQEQNNLETKILELERKIKFSDIIDQKNDPNNCVVFASTVTIEDILNNKISKYKIVGSDESDIGNGLLSVESPLARALIGKPKGDTIDVRTPSGTKTFNIKDVNYNE